MLSRFWMGSLGLVAGLALFFTGCGGGGDGDNGGGSGGNSIVGTWRMVSATDGGVTVTAEAMGHSLILTINADGTWTQAETEQGSATENSSGTWSVSGDRITVVTTGEEGGGTMPFSVSGSTLTITDEDGVVVRFAAI